MKVTSVASFVRKNLDWIILCLAALLVALLCVWAYRTFIGAGQKAPLDDRPHITSQYPVKYNVVAPDPKFPPPPGVQLPFDQTVNIEDVGIELNWADRNINRKSIIGPHVFILNIRNNLNAEQPMKVAVLKKISVGCSITEKPYQKQPIETMHDFTLQPYEKKQISLKIDVNCLYLGTADGGYFWRIY